MKVKDMINQLEQLNPEDECEIYIHHTHKLITETGVDLGGYDYLLIKPTIVDEGNGWKDLVTIECGEVVGC